MEPIKTTLTAFAVVGVTAVFTLLVLRHADQPGSTVTGYVPGAQALSTPQAHARQRDDESGMAFVGSVVTTYNGKQYQIGPDGTLVPVD